MLVVEVLELGLPLGLPADGAQPAQTGVNPRDKLVPPNRFEHAVIAAVLHRRIELVGPRHGGHQDDVRARHALVVSNPAQELHPVESRRAHIGEQEIDAPVSNDRPCGFTVRSRADLDVGKLITESRGDRQTQLGVALGNQNDRSPSRGFRQHREIVTRCDYVWGEAGALPCRQAAKGVNGSAV